MPSFDNEMLHTIVCLIPEIVRVLHDGAEEKRKTQLLSPASLHQSATAALQFTLERLHRTLRIA